MSLIKIKYHFSFIVFRVISPIKSLVDKIYNWSIAMGHNNLVVDFNRINKILKKLGPNLSVPIKIGTLEKRIEPTTCFNSNEDIFRAREESAYRDRPE